MNRLTAVAGVSAAAVALTLTAAGCSSSGKTEATPSTTSSAAPTSAEAPTSAPAAPTGTLDDYIRDAGLERTLVGPDQTPPTIDLPVPPGWSRTEPGEDSPYGGLVFDGAVSKDDPPRIKATLFKLSGNVDEAKVLALAASGLKTMPGFKPLGESANEELAGFKAAQTGGSYTKDGNSRLIAQKTAVIPTDGGVFVLELTADGLESDMGALMDATSVIDKQTKITP